MAKKYTVKATDDLLKLSERFKSSPSSILRSNGLQTLTPGQTIVIPQRPAASTTPSVGTGTVDQFGTAGYWGTYNAIPKPYNPTKELMGTVGNFLKETLPYATPKPKPTPYYAATSYTDPNLRPVKTGGNLSPDANGGGLRPAYTGFQTPTTNGFMSPGSQPVGGNFVGDQMGGQVPGTAVTPPPPAQPAVTRAEGKAQFLSGNGLNPQSGYIPTRSDVWNMKANSRRKAMAQSDNDENANDYVGGLDAPVELAPVVIPTLENQGNNSNAISWRVG